MADDDNNNNTSEKGDKNTEFDPGRRRFVKNTGMIVGGVAGGSLLGGFLTDQFTDTATEDKDKEKKTREKAPAEEARMFFTRYADFVVLEQATECIYPKDDNGPGAIKLGVPYFIDKQLAGWWGTNEREYRQGPFSNGSAMESSMQRGDLFIEGVRKMNKISQDRFDTSFDEADEDQQIEILEDFEQGKVDMKGVSSDGFFAMLRDATLEGAYSDPLYGGNRNMEGWKMKEYPGVVSSYKNMIEDEEFVKKEPVSLTDYQQKS